jgi:NAD(P)-dependent dehydrogenase (short-subunit alcohol dehydrogenase family)
MNVCAAMHDPLGFEGARTVVTGAASGIGAATAQVLVDLGAEVTALDIKDTAVPVARSLQVDLRDKAAIEDAAASFDAVDAYFNCAGVPGAPFSDVDVMVVNFVGARHLVELTVPKMAPGSAIAFVSSAGGAGWQAKLPTLLELITADGFDAGVAWCEAHPDVIGANTYFLSKQAITAWTAWRSVGLIQDHGIRLNCTSPGPTETPMMSSFRDQGLGDIHGPIGRSSTPEEQAWPLVVLNSPRMSYVVGESFSPDGGLVGALQTGQLAISNPLSE